MISFTCSCSFSFQQQKGNNFILRILDIVYDLSNFHLVTQFNLCLVKIDAFKSDFLIFNIFPSLFLYRILHMSHFCYLYLESIFRLMVVSIAVKLILQ